MSLAVDSTAACRDWVSLLQAASAISLWNSAPPACTHASLKAASSSPEKVETPPEAAKVPPHAVSVSLEAADVSPAEGSELTHVFYIPEMVKGFCVLAPGKDPCTYTLDNSQ